MIEHTQNRQGWSPTRAGLRPLLLSTIAALFVLHGVPVRAQQANSQAVDKAAAEKADASRTLVLGQRVEQLEEQIVDLQVVIGTLESLAKPGRRSPGAAFSNGRSRAGNGTLEAQVEALSAQVAKLTTEVQALQQARGGRPVASGAYTTPPNVVAAQPTGTEIGTGFGATTVNPIGSADPGPQPDPRVAGPPSGDQIGDLIAAPETQAAARQPSASEQVAVQTLPSTDAGEPKIIYEQAYGNMLQQDYAAAQAGFRSFLRKFPEHALVPNALYWLGETYYVQQNYTDAAEAFDIVTAAYGASNKAPDSQLKRGMSLANLGKRNEACTVFRSLAKRYPNAPEHVKSKADSERERVGCS